MIYDNDADLAKLDGKTVSILGYGSQGHAHALNLKESGVDVVVGLREDSSSVEKARADGLEVASIADAASRGDVVMVLLPDEKQAEIWEAEIADGIAPGQPAAVRARLLDPLRADRALQRGRHRDGRAEEPRPPGQAPVPGRERRAGPRRRSTRTRRATRATSCSPTRRASAARAPASSRRASARRPRRTCSASRRSSAAASPSWSAPATRRSSTPATTRGSRTSSASTS